MLKLNNMIFVGMAKNRKDRIFMAFVDALPKTKKDVPVNIQLPPKAKLKPIGDSQEGWLCYDDIVVMVERPTDTLPPHLAPTPQNEEDVPIYHCNAMRLFTSESEVIAGQTAMLISMEEKPQVISDALGVVQSPAISLHEAITIALDETPNVQSIMDRASN